MSEELNLVDEEVPASVPVPSNGSATYRVYNYSDIDFDDIEEPSSLEDIIQEPVTCPQCGFLIAPTALLGHFLETHIKNREMKCVEIYMNESFTQKIHPLTMGFNQRQVLKLFKFGGVRGELNSSPISSGTSLPNDILTMEHANYQEYSPVLLMITRTTMVALLGNMTIFKTITALNREVFHDIWIIWLAGPQMLKPLYATLKVYDKNKFNFFSRVVRVRNIADSQNCIDFLSKEVSFLDMRYPFVLTLSHNEEQPITLEVEFNDTSKDSK